MSTIAELGAFLAHESSAAESTRRSVSDSTEAAVEPVAADGRRLVPAGDGLTHDG
jgi:hypothetical protein